MSFARLFSKPRWQSKDDAVRRAAVAGDSGADLVAALPKLAREDTDAGVRLAALRRCADPRLAQALAQDDRDAGVRTAAQALWFDLLAGRHAASAPLDERLRLLRAQDDARLIEHLAVHAAEPALRLAALERTTRTALLVERATSDTDAGVRDAAFARIDDEAQLVRIAERTRRSDKKTSRRADERVTELRIARGDAATIHDLARGLCERLERLVRSGADDAEAAAIADGWVRVAARAPAELVRRHDAALALYTDMRDPALVAARRHEIAERERFAHELPAFRSALAAGDAVQRVESLRATYRDLAERASALTDPGVREKLAVDEAEVLARFDALDEEARVAAEAPPPAIEATIAKLRQDALLDQARVEKQRESERRDTALATLAPALEEVAAALEAGHVAVANARWTEIATLRATLGASVPAALRRRLAEVEEHHGRLAGWQRWSDTHRRRQLCDEIAALPASGLHPDAVATRVREAQAEWKQLDALESKRPGGDTLSRRFHGLCREAIEPTRAYFGKRDELRKAHAEGIVALLARAEATGDETDARTFMALRRELVETLPTLDRVDPRERKALAARLKAALTTIDTTLDARNAEVEAAKTRLIAAAEALATEADVRTAMASARDLQKRWQASGNGRRARDEAQWRAFRGAVDAVFARADGERSAREAREREDLDAAAAVCTELEALAAADVVPDRGAIARLEDTWRALGVRDGALRRRHDAAHDALREAHARRDRAKRRVAFDTWLAHYSIVRDLERARLDAGEATTLREALPALAIATTSMQARIDAAGTGSETSTVDADAAVDDLIELEQLTGVDSPAELRQRRLDLQVARLSARLRGDAAGSTSDTLGTLLARWTAHAPAATEASAEADDARLRAALSRVLDTL